MPIAQKWIEQNFDKNNTQEININYTCGNCLQGNLDLREYKNLKDVNLFRHEINSINAEGCFNLTHLHLKSNYGHLRSLNLNGCVNLTYLDFNDSDIKASFFNFKELPNLVNFYPRDNKTCLELLISKSDLPAWEKFARAFWVDVHIHRFDDDYRYMYRHFARRRMRRMEVFPNLEDLLEASTTKSSVPISIKDLVQDWQEEEWGRPEIYWNLLQDWVGKMRLEIKEYEKKWQEFSSLWNKRKEEERKKFESERLITESFDLETESRNLMNELSEKENLDKWLEGLDVKEESSNPFGDLSSNQLICYNQSLIISDQGTLADILREEKEKTRRKMH